MRHFLKLASLAGLVACIFSTNAAMAGKAIGASPASAYIQQVGDVALGTISNKSVSATEKQATLEKLFQANLDFEFVGKFVLGRHWKTATAEQRASYMDAYKEFLTNHYTTRFSEYTSGSFKVTGEHPGLEDSTVVSMEIISGQSGSPPVLIDYHVHKTNGGMKVFDIVVEGVSLLTTQRSEFNAVINKNGMDGLITRLQAK